MKVIDFNTLRSSIEASQLLHYCLYVKRMNAIGDLIMHNLLNLTEKEKTEIEKTFLLLKPVCDQIAVLPTAKNCEELRSVLGTIQSERLQLFDHYILVPIFMHLSNNRTHNSDTVCALLECLQTILELTEVSDLNLFLKMYVLIFRQILDETKPEKLSASSEELKLAVIKCSSSLIKRSRNDVLFDFCSRQHYGKISMGVYACISIAANEKCIRLKEEALAALIYLIQLHDHEHSSHGFRQQMADIVMLMLPGIVSKCLSIATASDIQNHKVILLAVRLWSRVVGLVMEDSLKISKDNKQLVFSLVKKIPIQDNAINWSGNQTKAKETLQNMTRCPSWIENSNKQLLPVTKAFTGLHNHQHWKVRLELVKAANYMLSKASTNLCLSVPCLIELLIILSQDEHTEVKSASAESIKSFSEFCKHNENVKSLIEIVEESLFELITKLPRILHGMDLTSKEKELSLVSGYLDILGSTHVPLLFRSSQHLHRLLNSMFIAASLDCSSISLLEEAALRGLDDQYSSYESIWRKFKYCNTQKSQFMTENICKKLAKYSNFSLFIHTLLDHFISDVSFRKEITLIFHYTFSSGNTKIESEIETTLNVFKELMDKNLWALPISPSEEEISKEDAQNNVVQVCLLTETLSSLASFIGPNLFSPLLLQCLYPLLECAGSPIYVISSAGLKSVNKIADIYGGGVGDLVANNVDYLSHHVTLNLRHAHRNPRVLSVLAVIVKHSAFTVLPSLHEIVNDVLVQSCDTFQEVNATAFLQVFHTIILCLNKWFSDEAYFPEKEAVCKKSIVEELMDYQKNKLEAEELQDKEQPIEELSEEEINLNVSQTENIDRNVPNYIQLTVQILKRSLHFLPSKIQTRQIIVLEILENGITLLRDWSDELLPIVHNIWSPLVKRLSNCDNHLILRRAFSLLKTLGRVSRDFIRIRTIKEVLPSLCNTLKDTSKYIFKHEKDAYKLSQKYKLQLCLLKGIGELTLDVELTEKEVDSILGAITPYLSDRQPETLQEACIHSFKLIAKEFPDLVWLHLMSICPKQLIFDHPHVLFPKYHIEDKSKEYIEYRKNVHYLLDVV